MAQDFVTKFRGEMMTPDLINIKNEPMTPVTPEDFGDYNPFQESPEEENIGTMRKSLSMGDLAAIKTELMNLNMYESNKKDHVYERYRKSTHCTKELSRTKFVSVAEAIYHFQKDTPDRFRTSRTNFTQHSGEPLKITRPQSPLLRCRARSRPQHVLSQKEREELELEELRKFKIKAQPVPKSVIIGPCNLPEVPKKEATVPEPFNLTEIVKKPAQVSPLQQFKARPAPKGILEKAQIPVKHVAQPRPLSCQQITKVKFESDKKYLEKQHHTKRLVDLTTVRHDGKTRPVPFSFEKRDEQTKRKKEERIRRQLEEEKQEASKFKAKPIPGATRKTIQTNNVKSSASTASSENKENYHFEAKPAKVLYKEPFKPVLSSMQATTPAPFDLNTDKRVQERALFEKKLREKEEEEERLRKQNEMEMKEIEKKNIAEYRAQLVHHPKPVLVKSPFIPQKSQIAMTVPETPKLVRRLKENSTKC